MKTVMGIIALAMILIMLGCVGSQATAPSQQLSNNQGSGKKCLPGSEGIVEFKGKNYCKTTAMEDGKPQTSYVDPESIGDPSKMDMWIVGTNEDGEAYEVHYQAGKSTETYINGELQ